MTKNTPTTVPIERITQNIVVLRGQKVLLDAHLAQLYGVTTKRFNEQVRRNLHRFPEDFMFQVNEEESLILRSHFATSSCGWLPKSAEIWRSSFCGIEVQG